MTGTLNSTSVRTLDTMGPYNKANNSQHFNNCHDRHTEQHLGTGVRTQPNTGGIGSCERPPLAVHSSFERGEQGAWSWRKGVMDFY